MFHYKTSIERRNERKEADRIIQEAVDANMRVFLEDLRKSEIPLEKHEQIIQRVRMKLQAEAFGLFEKELKEESMQNKPNSISLSK